jgi:hypothetical protein
MKLPSLDSADFRLRNRNWNELNITEQKCVSAASSLASNSEHIPLIASELLGYFQNGRTPELPQPEYLI